MIKTLFVFAVCFSVAQTHAAPIAAANVKTK
jgi:hypothetical protein